MMTMKTIKKAITLSLGLVMMGAASFAQSLADAKKAMDAEQYQKASSMLKTLVNSNAKEGENFYYLGETYLRTEDIDSAKAVFTKGTEADPKFALNFVGLGHAELKANNASAAKGYFDKAIALRAKDYDTYLHIGKAYLDLAKPDFASALPNLTKADELDSKDKEPEIFVALGDYWALQKDNTRAYQQYLAALDINPALYRASVQIGRMFKEAQGFTESEAALKKVTSADANYGPAYRELAELDLQWSYFDPKNGAAKRTEALTNYRKYLDLTDKSFDSRYRYAQFLVYAEDWTALEKELATLPAVDAKNPKSFIVLRLQGYSAVENKNYPLGVQKLSELFARTQDASRIMGLDYLYLGKGYQNTGNDSLALTNITKAVSLDSTKVDDLAEIAKKYYAAKNYAKAAQIYKTVVTANSKSPSLLTNTYTLGTSNYFAYGAEINAGKPGDRAMLVEADSAFAKVARLAPEYESTFLFRARVNNQIDRKDNADALKGLAVPYYEKYVQLVTVTKPEKAAANTKNLIEAYNNLGSFAALSDREKAKEYFNKTLALDPANSNATENLKVLNAPAAPVKKAPIKK
jgi:tetratricopeptide (TPR) repeat protein